MLKTAEAVFVGHPNKTDDYISSYILDRLIEQDPGVHYAVKVMIKDNYIMLGGEVKGSVNMSDIETYVKNAIREIGYDEHYSSLWKNYAIDVRHIHKQNRGPIGLHQPRCRVQWMGDIKVCLWAMPAKAWA